MFNRRLYLFFYELPIRTYLVIVYLLCLVQLSCDLMDCSSPGPSVHGISQAKILEWVSISSFRGSSWTRNQTWVSCIGRQILYHWATREARLFVYFVLLLECWYFSNQFLRTFISFVLPFLWQTVFNSTKYFSEQKVNIYMPQDHSFWLNV